MPAPLDVDREAVRVLAIAVGVREAARRMGISEDAVRQWSKREKWFAGCRPVQKLPVTMQPRAVTNVTAAEAMADSLADLGRQTRLNLARSLAKGAQHAASIADADAFSEAEKLGQLTRAAAPVFGWRDGDSSGNHVNIAINLPPPEREKCIEARELNDTASG